MIRACWDEYAATRLSATVGQSPASGYRQTFLTELAKVPRHIATPAVLSSDPDWEGLVHAAYATYGALFRWASYLTGDGDGRDEDALVQPQVSEALAGHWFAPYLASWQAGCQRLVERFGAWPDASDFEALGDILDAALMDAGLLVSSDGSGHWSAAIRPDLLE